MDHQLCECCNTAVVPWGMREHTLSTVCGVRTTSNKPRLPARSLATCKQARRPPDSTPFSFVLYARLLVNLTLKGVVTSFLFILFLFIFVYFYFIPFNFLFFSCLV